MTSGCLDLVVEDYGSRARPDVRPRQRESAGVPIPVLLALTVFFAGFVSVAVYLGQLAGAC